MIDIPKYIKDLLKSDTSKKNIRIVFPNHEHADITNKNIVINTFTFKESVCSSDELEFGKTEKSSVVFQMFDVENITNKIISIFLEVLCESDIQGAVFKQDLNHYVYQIPYGIFLVDSCKKINGKENYRSVIAYSYLSNENRANDYIAKQVLNLNPLYFDPLTVLESVYDIQPWLLQRNPTIEVFTDTSKFTSGTFDSTTSGNSYFVKDAILLSSDNLNFSGNITGLNANTSYYITLISERVASNPEVAVKTITCNGTQYNANGGYTRVRTNSDATGKISISAQLQFSTNNVSMIAEVHTQGYYQNYTTYYDNEFVTISKRYDSKNTLAKCEYQDIPIGHSNDIVDIIEEWASLFYNTLAEHKQDTPLQFYINHILENASKYLGYISMYKPNAFPYKNTYFASTAGNYHPRLVNIIEEYRTITFNKKASISADVEELEKVIITSTNKLCNTNYTSLGASNSGDIIRNPELYYKEVSSGIRLSNLKINDPDVFEEMKNAYCNITQSFVKVNRYGKQEIKELKSFDPYQLTPSDDLFPSDNLYPYGDIEYNAESIVNANWDEYISEYGLVIYPQPKQDIEASYLHFIPLYDIPVKSKVIYSLFPNPYASSDPVTIDIDLKEYSTITLKNVHSNITAKYKSGNTEWEETIIPTDHIFTLGDEQHVMNLKSITLLIRPNENRPFEIVQNIYQMDKSKEIFDMSKNYILNTYGSNVDIEKMIDNIRNIKYVKVDAMLNATPYIESADVVSLVLDNESFNTYVLSQNIKGIHNIKNQIQAGGI